MKIAGSLIHGGPTSPLEAMSITSFYRIARMFKKRLPEYPDSDTLSQICGRQDMTTSIQRLSRTDRRNVGHEPRHGLPI